MTFVAALRHDRITAPFLLEGPMNGASFRAYVEQMLAPALKRGDAVIMDNVGLHKVAGVREAIEARGATVLPFPPYSPDFNPIELVYSKFKAILRAAAGRSVRELHAIVRSGLKRFSPQQCAAFFRHAGYRST
jgi:transposase